MATTLSRKELLRQTTRGLIIILAVTGALIFALAGTFDYWQGWAYLAAFTLMCTVSSIYFLCTSPELIARRLHAGPTAEKEMSQRVVQTVSSILFVSILAVPALDRRFGWSSVPPAYSVVALVVFLLGYGLIVGVMHENRFAASIIEVTEGQTVISTGPYRYLRHPMYTGGLIAFGVTPIALGSWWGLIPAVALVFAIVARLKFEEQFLVKQLPGYDAYLAKTPARLVPWIW